MIENNNVKYEKNENNEKIPIKIISKNENSLTIQAFPLENNFINIILKNDFGYLTNIIIPPYKHINELFNIYAKANEIELFTLHFFINGKEINNFYKREISQVFNNTAIISISIY